MVVSKEKYVPELRFPEFTADWSLKKGDELFFNSRAKGEEGLPIYSVTLHDGLVPRESLDRRMENDAANEDNLRAQTGDLVYNMMRMWQGAVGLAETECMVSPAYVVLRAKKETDPKFFEWNFNRSRTLYDLWAYSYGLTNDRLRLYFKDFAQINFWVPSKKEEQQKIATFLSAIDDKLKKLRRKRELLETYKRGLMQKLFSQEIRFKKDDGSDFPVWEENPLSQLALRRTVKNADDSISRVLTNSATKGVVNQQDYFDKDIANSSNLEGYYIVEKGDYVYNPRISVHAPVGPINKNKVGKGLMSPLYSVFRFKGEDNEFYEQYFKTTLWHRYMSSVANYGASHDRMNISTADFMAMPLPGPHPDEQAKIVDFLRAIDRKIEATTQQVEKIDAFKKGLLQKMFV